jgi:inosine/xanthosine triphosphate pyrophosphatase family protein
LAKRVFNWLWFKWLERLFMWENIVKTWKFITVISYMDEKLDSPVSFLWEISGTYCFSLIKNFSNEDLQRFAYLPYKYIFKPNWFGKFYSELTRKESIKVSQRAKAVKKFLDWIKKKNNLFFNT